MKSIIIGHIQRELVQKNQNVSTKQFKYETSAPSSLSSPQQDDEDDDDDDSDAKVQPPYSLYYLFCSHLFLAAARNHDILERHRETRVSAEEGGES